MTKRTALYSCHAQANAKMMDFAGYEMPVQYESGIIKEHNAVRQRAGLFDVSHMGEFLLEGAGAADSLDYLLTNRFGNMQIGQVRYSPMCYENGGTVDDLLVYKLSDDCFGVVVNAANRQIDFDWMQKHLKKQTKLTDISDQVALIALQGPLSTTIVSKVVAKEHMPEAFYRFVPDALLGEKPVLLSRTGYTGEMGYEIYCRTADAPDIWKQLLAAGAPDGLLPCGLGARDTLRLEAGLPLYGHELSADISPLECGLDFAVKMDKTAFIGKEALTHPTIRKRIGIVLKERGIAREGAVLYSSGEDIGYITSGTMSPSTRDAIGMALVPVDFTGTSVQVQLRNKKVDADVVRLPFYKTEK